MKRTQLGLSLLEILLVIALIGILVGIGTASWKLFFQKSKLAGSVETIISDLRDVQQKTVSEQVRYFVRFADVGGNSYEIGKKEDNLTPPPDLTEIVLTTKELPLGIRIDGLEQLPPDRRVEFSFAGGVVDVTDTALIRLTNGVSTMSIEVKRSGFIRFVTP